MSTPLLGSYPYCDGAFFHIKSSLRTESFDSLRVRACAAKKSSKEAEIMLPYKAVAEFGLFVCVLRKQTDFIILAINNKRY